MSGPVFDWQYVTEDGDVWCCEECYKLAHESVDRGSDGA